MARARTKGVPHSPQGSRSLVGLPGFSYLPSLSAGRGNTGNSIVQGENLGVLESLLDHFEGTVQCCYIDPPYNNRENYYHYQDSADHRTWLDDTTSRIELLAEFLRDDGSLWISIDDREVHYLKVACDAILGRKNFVTTVVWQQRTSRENRKVFSNNHEYILVYAKQLRRFGASRNALPLSPDVRNRYKNPDGDARGPWQSVTATVQSGHATPGQFYRLVSPGGRSHVPPPGRCWVYELAKMREEIASNNIWFGRDGNGVPRIKRFLSDVRTGLTPETLWLATDVGTSGAAKKHLIRLLPDADVFDTPKPEHLLCRILEIASSPGDLVLDAYLGAGATAAVAHKMGRRYLGIERGEHAITHCARRLSMVVAGEQSGVSELLGWKGGGGFDFYRFKPR